MESLTNVEILIKYKKLKELTDTLEKIMKLYQEMLKLLDVLKSFKQDFVKNKDLFEYKKELVKTDQLFSKQDIADMEKEANRYTKQKLIENYNLIHDKYSNLSELNNKIDKMYYKDILTELLEDVF